MWVLGLNPDLFEEQCVKLTTERKKERKENVYECFVFCEPGALRS